MTRKYRDVVNRKRKEQKVEQGALVWVKRETTDPGVCKKLSVRWNGPYQVVEVLRNGGAYIVKDPFTSQQLQRVAEKIKPFHGDEQWLIESQDITFQAEVETKVLPPGVRRPPRRYIEED